jgi:hypothetical protein
MEVFADGKVITLDDYRVVSVSGRPRRDSSITADKGHLEELRALAHCLRHGGPWPITIEDQLRAMRVAFEVEARLSS